MNAWESLWTASSQLTHLNLSVSVVLTFFESAGAQGEFTIQPSLEFFRRLSKLINEQSNVIDRVFPEAINVMVPFLERVSEDVVGEYVTPVLDEAHERDIEMYLKAVGGIFQQIKQFSDSITRPKGAGTEEQFRHNVLQIMARVFEPHVDLYLQEELDYFRKKATGQVDSWGKKVGILRNNILYIANR